MWDARCVVYGQKSSEIERKLPVNRGFTNGVSIFARKPRAVFANLGCFRKTSAVFAKLVLFFQDIKSRPLQSPRPRCKHRSKVWPTDRSIVVDIARADSVPVAEGHGEI